MNNKIFLAPMSGVTDLSFRLISREFGAGHCFFEMLDAKALVYNHPNNKYLLKTTDKDLPISAQLIGAEPDFMLEAAQKLIDLVNIKYLDVNSACPARKVLKKGAGAALLSNTKKIEKIIKKLSSYLPVPVTVKIRSGFNHSDVKGSARTAKICQDAGAKIIFIHGRSASQGYAGDIDYSAIRAVKNAVKIPVFGSGNVLNPVMAKRMLDETGCDGILVARGSCGNPWIFKDIANYLKNKKIAKTISLIQKKKVLNKHLKYLEKYKDMDPKSKLGYMGQVAMWYLKGVYDATTIRHKICNIKSFQELIGIIKEVK